MIKRLEEQIKYFAQRGRETNSSTLCDRAHSLQTQLERIKKRAVARPKVQKSVDAKFDEQKKTSKRVIETKDFSVILPNGQKILDRINIFICAGERVAIIGKNGCGKSTLIKSIMGVQDLEMHGEIIVGPSVKIGYLPQIITFPDENQSVLEYFENESGLSEERARKVLAGMQFYKNDVTKRVKNLSGGEKMRVKLALLLQQKINTLIFDEPTNHIDIPTKEMLEEALGEFEGRLIFISHDRYFINKFATRIWHVKDGMITDFIGTYDEYAAYCERQKQTKTEKHTEKKEKKPDSKPKSEKKGLSYNEKKQLKEAENEIRKLEKELEFFASEEEKYSTDYEKLSDIAKAKEAAENRLLELYEVAEKLNEKNI